MKIVNYVANQRVGFTFTIAISPANQTIAEVTQNQLEDAGIDMSINLSNNAGNDFQATQRFQSSFSQSGPGRGTR